MGWSIVITMINYSTRLQMAGLLAERAAKLGLTQEDLAFAAGISQPHISQIFSGRRVASVEMLDKIAASMGARFETRLEEL